MNMLKYKGFVGSVEYSQKDKIFFGKIEGINGLVNDEDRNAQDLNTEFENVVNGYQRKQHTEAQVL